MRFFFTLNVLLLSLAGAAARAFAEGSVVPAVPLDVTEILAQGAVAAVLVSAWLLFWRAIFPNVLAPVPATEGSKLFSLLLALIGGLALGALGVAPSVAAGWGGKLLGGFLVAAVALFGRDAIVRGYRVGARNPGGKGAGRPLAAPESARKGIPG